MFLGSPLAKWFSPINLLRSPQSFQRNACILVEENHRIQISNVILDLHWQILLLKLGGRQQGSIKCVLKFWGSNPKHTSIFFTKNRPKQSNLCYQSPICFIWDDILVVHLGVHINKVCLHVNLDTTSKLDRFVTFQHKAIYTFVPVHLITRINNRNGITAKCHTSDNGLLDNVDDRRQCRWVISYLKVGKYFPSKKYTVV
jgi:hypothetical protein